MAKKNTTDELAVKGDHLKYYCIVFGILVIVIAVVALQQRSKLKAYEMANRQARALLKATGKAPDGRPRGIGDLAVEVEKFVKGYKESLGGAAGNVICVHNVVAASAVVGMVGREGEVIRKTVVVFFYYVLFAGLLGLMFA